MDFNQRHPNTAGVYGQCMDVFVQHVFKMLCTVYDFSTNYTQLYNVHMHIGIIKFFFGIVKHFRKSLFMKKYTTVQRRRILISKKKFSLFFLCVLLDSKYTRIQRQLLYPCFTTLFSKFMLEHGILVYMQSTLFLFVITLCDSFDRISSLRFWLFSNFQESPICVTDTD